MPIFYGGKIFEFGSYEASGVLEQARPSGTLWNVEHKY